MCIQRERKSSDCEFAKRASLVEASRRAQEQRARIAGLQQRQSSLQLEIRLALHYEPALEARVRDRLQELEDQHRARNQLGAANLSLINTLQNSILMLLSQRHIILYHQAELRREKQERRELESYQRMEHRQVTYQRPDVVFNAPPVDNSIADLEREYRGIRNRI